jgi:hypothetical protein
MFRVKNKIISNTSKNEIFMKKKTSFSFSIKIKLALNLHNVSEKSKKYCVFYIKKFNFMEKPVSNPLITTQESLNSCFRWQLFPLKIKLRETVMTILVEFVYLEK